MNAHDLMQITLSMTQKALNKSKLVSKDRIIELCYQYNFRPIAFHKDIINDVVVEQFWYNDTINSSHMIPLLDNTLTESKLHSYFQSVAEKQQK